MRITLPREFYIPKDSREIKREGIDAVAYEYEKNEKPYAIGFIRKQSKPAFHFRFLSIKNRQNHIDKFFENVKGSQDYKAAYKAEEKAFEHSFQVGDVVHHSWGWEQTNCDFYQVVEVPGKKSIVIREIASQCTENGFMSGHAMPLKDHFLTDSKPMLKKVRKGDCVSFKHGSASKWDGKPEYYSYYA